MKKPALSVSIIIMAMMLPSDGATAQKTPELNTDRPKIFDDLIQCRQIEDINQRVACYDRNVDILDKAEADNELIVADREEVKEARKGLFGFRLPKIKLFSGGDDDDDTVEIKEVETTLVSARQFGRGKWRIRLENDSVWEQTDSRKLSSRLKAGTKVVIKRASLGSFLIKIGSNPTLRMRRIE